MKPLRRPRAKLAGGRPFPSLWKRMAWVAVAAFLGLQGYFLLQVVWLLVDDPNTTAFMDAERERLGSLEPPKPLKQVWVDYDKISMAAKRAVVAAEDSGFTDHDGIEWEAIERAAQENLKRGKIRQGGSTITMQLAKNLFLSADRSLFRKGQEIIITGMLEVILDKRRILEIYLNVAEWGVGIFGIEMAAQHYYGVSARQLTASQAAWLASILPAPKRADRRREAPWILRKAAVIERRMQQVAVPR